MNKSLRSTLTFAIAIILAIMPTTKVYADIEHQQPQPTSTFIKRRLTNALDIAIFSITVKVVNQYFMSKELEVPTGICIIAGTGSWLAGELAEAIYKNVYEHFSHKRLCDTLGTCEICGIEIDNQHLLRRVISITTMLCFLYIHQQAFNRYNAWINDEWDNF